jgi:hypothetical protein
MCNLINKKELLLKMINDIELKIIIIWKWRRGRFCIISLYIKKRVVGTNFYEKYVHIYLE